MEGSLAYASQEPWIQSGTLRENILFGRRMDRKRYSAQATWRSRTLCYLELACRLAESSCAFLAYVLVMLFGPHHVRHDAVYTAVKTSQRHNHPTTCALFPGTYLFPLR